MSIGRHFTRVFLAGIIALLPIGGLVLTVVYLETTIATTWVRGQWWYVPGLGIVAAVIAIYLIGLTVSTFIGKWAWRLFDRLLDRLPALGTLYRTLKQILGYGEGKDSMFHSVVLVPTGRGGGVELGLVTNEIVDGKNDHDGQRPIDGLNPTSGRRSEKRLAVFIPGSPSPTAGRLVVIPAGQVYPVQMQVSEALKALVSAGKTLEGPLELDVLGGDAPARE